jgi:acyl carrier protein
MAEATPELKHEIKELIIDALKIPDVKPEEIEDSASPEEIEDSASLFEGENSLQIDSVDALEIVMALQRTYGVHIDDKNPGRFIIKSVDTIAEFVARETADKG